MILRQHGVSGIEIAPTKIWPRPLKASPADVVRYRQWWEARGLSIVAMQALLFGRPDLALFAAPEKREAAAEYLEGIIALAGRLGAYALVFGSPANRKRAALDPGAAWETAIPFFRRLGEAALVHGVCLCVEPNPPEYGCDWITSAAEAVELVDAVGVDGFGVHLDTAAMHLVSDPPACIAAAGRRLCHFHVSTPFLHGVPGEEGVAYAAYARALQEQRYPGWVSIEMAEPKLQPDWRDAVHRALAFVRKTFAERDIEQAA